MYIFNAKLSELDKGIDTLVVFSGQLEGDDFAYGARLEKELAKYSVAPDNLIFIFPKYLTPEMLNLSNERSRLYRNITRYGDKTKVQLVTFDGFGEIENFSIQLSEIIFYDYNEIRNEIIKQGLINLVHQRGDKVIQSSPPGTIFVKPSGEMYDEFIKASELSIGYAQNQFVSFCLLSKRPKNKEIKNIWIDSSGISTFVDCLCYYMYKFSKKVCKDIKYHSFNSYEKLEELKPDYVDDIWMIISASTSNNLGIRACKKWGLSNEQVVTLLSYTDTSTDSDPSLEIIGDEIIVNISDFSNSRKNINKSGSAIGLRVMGENFTPHVKEPNRINIKAAHKPSNLEKSIFSFYDLDLFYCNRVDKRNRLRNIFVDTDYVFSSEYKPKLQLISWLKGIFDWHFPIDTKWIVLDTQCLASNSMLEVINTQLQKYESVYRESIKILNFEQAKTNISGNGAVVIISPVISSARSLLVLNRNLRISKHKGNRIFIVPFVVSSSKHDYEKMVKTLTYGPNSNKYGFYEKHKLFVGNASEKNSWTCEREVIENFSDSFWIDRAKTLAKLSVGLLNNIATPSAPSVDELSFSQDFAFWPVGYKPSEARSTAIFLSVASILQGLRDKNYTIHDPDSLSSNIYQHAVLDPDNFFRFDDPLLHSCLWRAATSSELDWSSSLEMSGTFKSFMLRQMDMNHNGDKNAMLDLFIGIACRKIQISKGCTAEIIDKAYEIFDSHAIVELLNFIDVNIANREIIRHEPEF